MTDEILIFRSQIIAGQVFPEKGRVKILPDVSVPIRAGVEGGILPFSLFVVSADRHGGYLGMYG